jgi:hypothetical protein
MIDPNDDLDDLDDLDELLAPPPAAQSPGVRDAILRRTERRLALRRWTRHGVRAAAVAAVFAAGLILGVRNAPHDQVPAPEPRVEVVSVPVPVFVPLPGGPVESSPPQVAKRSGHELELDAEQADDAPAAARLYRRAGDAYLDAEQDYANAARCYRLFLARAGESALAPEPGDSWLLTSLKNAAFKEKVHATATND